MKFLTVCGTEIAKLKRVKLTWITLLIMLMAAVAINGMFWVIRHPGMAANLGLLGQKANFSFGGTTPDWAFLITALSEMTGLGGLLLASFLLAWIFGREYLLGTAKNLLVLPIRRWWIVAAKSLVVLVWQFLLMAILWAAACGLALAQGLPGYGDALLATALPKALLLCLAGWGIALPAAWIANKSRGVFAPLGYAFGTLMCATLFGNLGWGPYIPWSALEIYSGAGGKGLNLDLFSWIVITATVAAGFGLTARHLQKADNTQ